MSRLIRIGCYGVIFDKNQKALLVLRDDYDLWGLPGGGIDKEESLKECVRREVWEETGYRVAVGDLAGVYLKSDRDDLVFTFLCRLKSGQPRLNKEARAIEFWPINKLPKNITRNTVTRIKDAARSRGQVFLRLQKTPDLKKFKI